MARDKRQRHQLDGVFMQGGGHGKAPLLTRRACLARWHAAGAKAIRGSRGHALVTGADSHCAHVRRDKPYCLEKCELRPYSSFTTLVCSFWW
jgi:hypothetical protein